MKIHQLYTHNELRNFCYIIELSDQSAVVIDPWDADDVNLQLIQLNLKLTTIINTHEHWDHTQGNSALVEKHHCEVWAHQNGEGKIPNLSRKLNADEIIQLDKSSELVVLDTPGHTLAHLCFVIKHEGEEKAVFTGDTLFNAGVGNCRGGGDAAILYETVVKHFQSMKDSVIVYPGHDYLENNLQFTLNFEAENEDAKTWLDKVTQHNYSPGDLQTTIGDEKTFNTFLRLDNSQIIKSLELDNPSAKDVFISLRSKRDNW